MKVAEIISEINFWAVVVAALSSFVIGSLWYGPLFGKTWMKLNGFTDENLKEGLSIPAIMGINYAATLLAAFALALFTGPESDLLFGAWTGFMVAFFWIGTSRLNDVLFERQPLRLFALNAGYYLVVYVIMGAIIGSWH